MSERDDVIWFGKHAGRSVWDAGEDFCRWLIAQPARTERFRRLQECAKDAVHCADDGHQQHYANELRWDGQ